MDDTPRNVAIFFFIISAIGALPAAYWTFVLVVVVFLGDGQLSEAAGPMAVLLYAALGFAQLCFYATRSKGRFHTHARRWWLSTYLYNLVPLAISIWVFADEQHIAAAIAGIWFAALSALAIVAYRGEEVLLRNQHWDRPTSSNTSHARATIRDRSEHRRDP